MKQFRQGDVLLIEVAQLPKKTKQVTNVLALGEYSGHAHIAKSCDVLECDSEKFVVAKKGAILSHEKNGKIADHQPIELPEGIYKVVLQKQYNPLNGWEVVAD